MRGSRNSGPRATYDPEAINQANSMATKQAQYAKDIQRRQEQSKRDNAVTAIGKNTPGYLQPPGGLKPGMSRVDQEAAVNRATGAPLVPPPQMNLAAGPKYTPGGATPPASVPFRGSTGQEIADFRAGYPKNQARTDTAAAAGTGKTVQTPYGTASSTQLGGPSGQVAGPNLTGPAGAANWQQQVVNAHPEIGVKDSPENKAFVAAYKQEQANGNLNPDKSPKDHMAMAQTAVKSVQTQGPSQISGEPGAKNPTDPMEQVAAAGKGAASGASEMASSAVTPKTIGQNIAKVPGAVGNAAMTVPNTAANIADAAGTIGGEVYSGLTGKPSPYVPGSAPAALTAATTAGKAALGYVPGGEPSPQFNQGQNAAGSMMAGVTAPGPSNPALDAAQAHADAFHKSVSPLFRSAASGAGGGVGSSYSPPAGGYAGTANDAGPVAPTPQSVAEKPVATPDNSATAGGY